jgi:two-component system, NarL family, nitrate/nitrite response regulator NarL
MKVLVQQNPGHRPAPLRVWIAAAEPDRRRQLIRLVHGLGHAVDDSPVSAMVILADGVIPKSSLPILALGMPGEDVDGSLPAGASDEQIDAGLRAVAAGLRVSARDPAQSGFAALDESSDAVLLTSRETEVLAAAAKGMSNKEIARELGISLHTVKFHLESLTRKLHAQGRTEAVAKAITLGLLQALRI